MIINLKKIGNWLLDRIATIALTLAVGALLQVSVAGFKEVHTIYADFETLKKNSQIDLLAHRQIQIKDSLQALYKDTVNNRFLTIEGTLEAHADAIVDIQSQILKAK